MTSIQSSEIVKCGSLGLKTVKTTCKMPQLNSYLIVGAHGNFIFEEGNHGVKLWLDVV